MKKEGRLHLVGNFGLKGQAKPSFGIVGEEAPCYSVLNGQEEKTEVHLREVKSETFCRLHSFVDRALIVSLVAWLGSHDVPGDCSEVPPDGT